MRVRGGAMSCRGRGCCVRIQRERPGSRPAHAGRLLPPGEINPGLLLIL